MGGPGGAPNLRRTLAAQLLLLTLLLASSPGASAVRPGPRRTLQQLSDGAATGSGSGAGPAAEAGPLLAANTAGPSPVCAALVDDLLSNCAISADRIAMTYGRGSEVQPTSEEQAASIAELKSAGLPPLKCVHARLPAQRCHPAILQHVCPSVLPPAASSLPTAAPTEHPTPCPAALRCRCCVAVASFISTDCFCSAAALASLGEQLDQTGAVEAAYVQGAAAIMHRACSAAAQEPCARWVAG